MEWLALVTGLLKLASAIAGYLADRRLISAGEAQAVARGTEITLENIDKARRAADAVEHPASAADDDYANRVRGRFERPE